MRSVGADMADAPASSRSDDRTASARIRDAALLRFATDGVERATVRSIARDAGVSPALVIHHFGSKDGLRAACDEHVAAAIREVKQWGISQGIGLDPLAGLSRFENGTALLRYLGRTIVDSSPAVDRLIDELVDDAVGYSADAVEAGIIRPSERHRERAALLMIWALGTFVLADHVERLIGVDVTALPDDPEAATPYLATMFELYAGVLTPDAAERLGAMFDPTDRSDL